MRDICRCGRYKLHEGFAYPLNMSDGPTVPIIESTHRINACLPGGAASRSEQSAAEVTASDAPCHYSASEAFAWAAGWNSRRAQPAAGPPVNPPVASADLELAKLLREARKRTREMDGCSCSLRPPRCAPCSPRGSPANESALDPPQGSAAALYAGVGCALVGAHVRDSAEGIRGPAAEGNPMKGTSQRATAQSEHECKGVVLCRRCAARYFGKSSDWFDDHVREEIPAVVVEGRASGWRREHLDRWLKLHTEGAWADEPGHLSPSTVEAPGGGSSSGSRGRGAGNQLRAAIGERLKPGRQGSGRKRKRVRGNLRSVPSSARSSSSETTSSHGSRDTAAPRLTRVT
jgi:hypothetical protein